LLEAIRRRREVKEKKSVSAMSAKAKIARAKSESATPTAIIIEALRKIKRSQTRIDQLITSRIAG
jgi:hypothetical protein